MLRDKPKITSFCDVLKYLRRIRGESEGLGHSGYPVENVSAEIPSFNEHIPDNMVAWEGIGYLTAKESVPQFLQSSQQPWKGREYDLSGRSQFVIHRFTSSSLSPSLILNINSRRRDFWVIIDNPNNAASFAPFPYTSNINGGIQLGRVSFNVQAPQYILINERDWGAWVYGEWYGTANVGATFTVSEQIWI